MKKVQLVYKVKAKKSCEQARALAESEEKGFVQGLAMGVGACVFLAILIAIAIHC
jgi:hypothetical protein